MGKRTLHIIAFGAVLLAFFTACSTKKNTSGSRFYHAMTARFNTYFNGSEAFKEGILAQQEGHKDNYTELLPMYNVRSKATAAMGKSNFETAIEKCEKAIKQHSIKARPKTNVNKRKTEAEKAYLARKEFNPFLRHAWLLMGKAQFQQGNFIEAASLFNYICTLYATQPEIVSVARAWLARCYVEMEWPYDAEDVFQKIRRDSIGNEGAREFNASYADYLISVGQYKEAIPYLQKTIRKERNKKQKARLNFLLGQLYHETGQKTEAYKALRRVIRSNPPYELSFNAPEIPSFGDVYYNLYRNGFLVRTIAQNSEEDGVTFDAATGRFTFVDPNLPNGRYDYFVQTVIKDEVGDSIAYNVSNTIYVTPDIELPAATNLRVVKYGILNGSDLVTVAWDAPEYTDEHRFERYNVFITELGMRAAENNEEDGQPTEYTLTFRFPAEHIYVQTQYYYGKVNSDTIYYVLNEHEPDYTDGIEAASAAESVVKVGETAITVDGVASSMAVYTAGGAVVASAKNASSLDIASLQRGVYIAIVDIDRRHYVVKFTK